MQYENVTQNVLLLIESILQNAKQLQHVRLYFVSSGLKTRYKNMLQTGRSQVRFPIRSLYFFN
jgi:hypothetical protein